MTLDNFEKSIPANRLKNGLAYFRKGKVIELLEDEDGDWKATVVGTETYYVDISMDGHKIHETDCTCISYNEDDQCKHIAAVLYAISAGKDQEVQQRQMAEIPEHILALLAEMQLEDLRAILKVELKGNAKLMDSFESMATYLIECRGADDLAEILMAKIEQFEQDGSIAKKHLPAILDVARSYIRAANDHWKNNEVKQAIDHLLAVTLVLPNEAELIEDENGGHRTVILEAFQLLDKICTKGGIPEKTAGMLSDRAFSGAVDPNIPVSHYNLHWVDLIVKHGLAHESEEECIAMLNELIATSAGSDKERLLRLKTDFLRGNGQKQEAMKIVTQHPAIANEQEKALLSASQKKHEYKIIKEQMLTELKLARTTGDRERYASLQKLIIELLTGTGDVLELRKLAEQFYAETSDPYFFEAMRETYMKSEWERVKSTFPHPPQPLSKRNGKG